MMEIRSTIFYTSGLKEIPLNTKLMVGIGIAVALVVTVVFVLGSQQPVLSNNTSTPVTGNTTTPIAGNTTAPVTGNTTEHPKGRDLRLSLSDSVGVTAK